MSDLWTEASRDVEEENAFRRTSSAKLSVTSFWPFLAAAETETDFENRLALVGERIEAVVPDNALRAETLASLREDYRLMVASRPKTAIDSSGHEPTPTKGYATKTTGMPVDYTETTCTECGKKVAFVPDSGWHHLTKQSSVEASKKVTCGACQNKQPAKASCGTCGGKGYFLVNDTKPQLAVKLAASASDFPVGKEVEFRRKGGGMGTIVKGTVVGADESGVTLRPVQTREPGQKGFDLGRLNEAGITVPYSQFGGFITQAAKESPSEPPPFSDEGQEGGEKTANFFDRVKAAFAALKGEETGASMASTRKGATFSKGDRVVLTEEDHDPDMDVTIPAGTTLTVGAFEDGLVYTDYGEDEVVVDATKCRLASLNKLAEFPWQKPDAEATTDDKKEEEGAPPAEGEAPKEGEAPAEGGDLAAAQAGAAVTLHYKLADGTEGDTPATVQVNDGTTATFTYDKGTFKVTNNNGVWTDPIGTVFTMGAAAPAAPGAPAGAPPSQPGAAPAAEKPEEKKENPFEKKKSAACTHPQATKVESKGLGGWSPIEVYECDTCGVRFEVAATREPWEDNDDKQSSKTAATKIPMATIDGTPVYANPSATGQPRNAWIAYEVQNHRGETYGIEWFGGATREAVARRASGGPWKIIETAKYEWSGVSPRQTPFYASMQKGASFAGYEDFDACVAANQDKEDPDAYCGKIKHEVEGAKPNPYGSCPKCGSGRYRKDLKVCVQCGYKAEKKTAVMGDPYWTTASYGGTCSRKGCNDPINRGDRIFFYPSTNSAYVGIHAEQAARDFQSSVADEGGYSDYFASKTAAFDWGKGIVGRQPLGFPGAVITKVEPTADYLMHGPVGDGWYNSEESRYVTTDFLVHVTLADGREVTLPKSYRWYEKAQASGAGQGGVVGVLHQANPYANGNPYTTEPNPGQAAPPPDPTGVGGNGGVPLTTKPRQMPAGAPPPGDPMDPTGLGQPPQQLPEEPPQTQQPQVAAALDTAIPVRCEGCGARALAKLSTLAAGMVCACGCEDYDLDDTADLDQYSLGSKTADIEDMSLGGAGIGAMLRSLIDRLLSGGDKTIPSWFPKSYLTPEEIASGRFMSGGNVGNWQTAFGAKEAWVQEGDEKAADEKACDHFEPGGPGGDDPNTCKNCFWAIGAHDAKAGGPSGVGKMPEKKAEWAQNNTAPATPVTQVKENFRCSNCLIEFVGIAVDPAQPIPNCPNCGSEATTAAGAVASPTRAVGHVDPKVAQIAEGILSTNPGMTTQAALRLATETVRRYPKVAAH